MGDPKERKNGMGMNTVGQDSIRTNTSDGQMVTSANNQSYYLSNLLQQGGNTMNNRNSENTSTANKDFKGEIETFGSVLALRYGKVYLK